MSRVWKQMAGALLVLALGVAGCGSSGGTSDGGAAGPPGGTSGGNSGAEPIKIGFFAPITGAAAADGTSAQRAAELAVEEINAAGGIDGREVRLIAHDDRLDPKEAVNIANKLIGEKVVAVVSGSYSGPTRAVAPVLQQARIPMITAYAIHPEITSHGKYMFRQSFIGSVQGRAGAEAAVGVLGKKRIAILYIDNDFGQTLHQSFKERATGLGATIVAEEKFPAGEKDFGPLLTRIREKNPDLIYVVAYAAEGSVLVRQAKALGITAQLLGTEGLDSTEQFLKVAGEAAEGVIITTNLNRDDTRDVARNFIANFKQKYGVEPDMVGASTYDAVKVLADAIKRAGSTDPDKLADAIRSTKDFEAVTGTIKGYTDKGEVMKTVQLQIVKDGAFRYFGVVDNPEVYQVP
ncbi:MAG: ABC transporter substrate-binding protein [Bacillota bacterium]|nr:MAG: ABC transporter substrate-binding protein [Bacillota bacterium]